MRCCPRYKVIAKVNLVYIRFVYFSAFMANKDYYYYIVYVEQREMTAYPQTKPILPWLYKSSYRLLSSIPTIHI